MSAIRPGTTHGQHTTPKAGEDTPGTRRPHGREDSVEHIAVLSTALSPCHLQLPVLLTLDLARRRGLDELRAVCFHVRGDHVGDGLVEASQEDGTDHDGRVVARAREESGAFQRDIGGTDDQRLARVVVKGEDVVGIDSVPAQVKSRLSEHER